MFRIITPLLVAAALSAQTKSPVENWDRLYASRDARVPVNPSALVLETTANLKPGAALDVGMGNGRNAVYLARKGWKVTGIDMSREAVKAATAEAQKLGTSVEAVIANFETYAAGREQYDLILCLYVPPAVVVKQARKIMEALKPGGLLIVEGQHADADNQGYKDNQLVKTFSSLRVLRYEDRLDRAEWGNGGEGRAAIVRLVARK